MFPLDYIWIVNRKDSAKITTFVAVGEVERKTRALSKLFGFCLKITHLHIVFHVVVSLHETSSRSADNRLWLMPPGSSCNPFKAFRLSCLVTLLCFYRIFLGNSVLRMRSYFIYRISRISHCFWKILWSRDMYTLPAFSIVITLKICFCYVQIEYFYNFKWNMRGKSV